MHIEELDTRAISLLSQFCSSLNILGFYNCGFQETVARPDDAFMFIDRLQRQSEENMVLSLSWLDVEKLNITSEVSFYS